MQRLKPTQTVKLSCYAFALWWAAILGVHVAVCLYNAIYAHYYWMPYLDLITESFQIGMPRPYHHPIAIAHITMSAMHAIAILLMLGGSIWQRSLAFTPWASCTAEVKTEETKSDRTNSAVLRSFTKAYDKVSDRHGLFGVNGVHFHRIQACREVIQTVFQTHQAYRMSMLLPRTLLNRFYVILIAMNCTSWAAVNSFFFQGDEARRRLAVIVLDCTLNLMACVGVQVIVVLSYSNLFDLKLQPRNYLVWYDNETIAIAVNEFQTVVIVSWMDLVSRIIFSLGLIATTTTLKELLQRLPRNTRRVSLPALPDEDTLRKEAWGDQLGDIVPVSTVKSGPKRLLLTLSRRGRGTNIRLRPKPLALRAVYFFMGGWGIVVLGFHMQASVQPLLPQCLVQVRPWAVSRPSCYLAGLDCHALGISGLSDEVDAQWSAFDSSTVVQLLIRHCPALEIPARLSEFHSLRGIKMYNSTIVDWGESVALTETNHPHMLKLSLIRVNMTDGVVPAGLLSVDFPPTVFEIELCVTNVREVPDDLDTIWPSNAYTHIQVEYSHLTVVHPALLRLRPGYLALTGNPITELPPGIFEIDSVILLGISDTNIHELPRNVTKLSASLKWVSMRNTKVSFFWDWADELVEQTANISQPWVAGYSTYCDDLAKIENGTVLGFNVPLVPEYSQTLMNASKENLQVIRKTVNCDARTGLPSGGGMFYPLLFEDSMNAISTPPTLVRPIN
ncbi:hypothetical protein ON010_g6544 [Phytophthora cinnamomi]|nr:hypothetical protein ON010_g6544 [Phytophthora cinnamomi]